MRSPHPEPDSEELETLREDEERRVLDNPNVPDDVKSEVTERLDRLHDEDVEDELEDEPPPR